MNPGTLTLPLRAVTIKKGSEYISVSINPSLIQSAITSGTGSSGLLFFGDSPTAFTSTSSPATLLSGLPYIPVTITGVVTYIPTAMMQNWRTPPTGSGCSIDLLTNPIGREYQTVTVSESKATVDAAYEAVAAAAGGGGGGGTASVTAAGATQGTATAITTSTVRITGGAAATGVILTAATAGEECWIQNATTSTKVVYPATGEFIDPSLVNEGVTIGAGESILFKCTLAAHWASEIQVSNTQVVTPTGTVQGGGQIKTGVTNVFVNPTALLNTAVTLPPATVGYSITISIATTVANAQLFPAGTDQINLSGAGTRIFLKANSTQSLVCNEAGYWVDGSSAVKNLIVETLSPRVSGLDVAINDTAGANIALFGTDIRFLKDLSLYAVAAAATAGGNQATGTVINSNVFTITACATLGDSCTMGATNYVWIKNEGVAPAYVYCALGGTMNGILNGYVIIAPGQVYYISGFSGAAYSTLLTSPAGSYVAAAGITVPHVIHPTALVTTVAAPGDAVQLDPQCPSVRIKNNGANPLTVQADITDTINGSSSPLLCPIGSVVDIDRGPTGDWIATFSSPGRQSGTAFATGGQASGTPVISSAVVATTVASANDSFTIQPFSPRQIVFANDGANSLDLFPPVGGQIDALGVNNAFAIAATARVMLLSNDGSVWVSHVL